MGVVFGAMVSKIEENACFSGAAWRQEGDVIDCERFGQTIDNLLSGVEEFTGDWGSYTNFHDFGALGHKIVVQHICGATYLLLKFNIELPKGRLSLSL